MTERLVAEPQAGDEVDGRPAPAFSGQVGVPLAAIAAISLSTRSGLGVALTLAGMLIVVARSAGSRTEARRWCAAAGLLLPWLVIRDNGWLAVGIVVTVAAVAALSAMAGATGQRVSDLSLGAIFRREPQALGSSDRPEPRQDLGWAVVRGVTAAVPPVLLFWMLLADADDVFASVFDLNDLPVGRLVLFLLFIPAAGAIVRFAAEGRPVRPGQASLSARFGAVESSIVLGAVSALFAAFIALRLATLDRPVESDAWRSEVRSGFFQLLFVAALTVLLVLAIRRASGSAGLTGRVRTLGWVTIVLAAGIDALALLRIAQYVNWSFLSPLRFWSFGFGVWLLVLLALTGLRLSGVGAGSKWFTSAALATWMVFLFSFGLANPDQRIAQYNFDAFEPTVVVANGEPRWVAVKLLSWLSEDATPVIAQNLNVLRPMPNTRYERMLDHLCTRELDESWRDWNLSRSAARGAIEDLC